MHEDGKEEGGSLEDCPQDRGRRPLSFLLLSVLSLTPPLLRLTRFECKQTRVIGKMAVIEDQEAADGGCVCCTGPEHDLETRDSWLMVHQFLPFTKYEAENKDWEDGKEVLKEADCGS